MWARRIWRRAVEVGDGARDAQHAVVAARGQVHALGRAQQRFAPGDRVPRSSPSLADCHRRLR